MVPDSFWESQGAKECVCLLRFAMIFLLGNKTCKMLSAVCSDRSSFEGMVKWDPVLWGSNNENHEEKKRP